MAVTQALKRVERLEAATGGGGVPPCRECGGDDREPDEGDVFEVVFVAPDEDRGPEFCEACGRRTAYNIYFPEHLPPGR